MRTSRETVEISALSTRLLAHRLYGLSLRKAKAPARHGRRYRPTSADRQRRLVLRVSEPEETEENLNFQNVVLGHLAGARLHFTAPEMLQSSNGEPNALIDDPGRR